MIRFDCEICEVEQKRFEIRVIFEREARNNLFLEDAHVA
jgi:hypothetical protein